MKTLAIDTSNQTLAVAVVDGHQILGQSQTMAVKNHSTALMPAIQQMMQMVDLKSNALSQIVVAKGPGSYTGLRIGVTTAKTLAQTLDIPLIGVSSLKTIAANCVGTTQWIIPLFDARRNNVYTGIYQWQGNILTSIVEDQHTSMDNLLAFLQKETNGEVLFVGSDTAKFARMIKEALPQAIINQVPIWDYPSAAVLALLAAQEEPVPSIHGFVPSYLKLVEAEENWLAVHEAGADAYVEKI
ncbi:tRNA threonylcarbamoyl adenosine modification protein YeaZ [Enterococcus sp. 8G7_MSG3316]|uniref:tRNA threonylcarbamoyl adenosine modification protein YeaZ n=1 Tax=Candidatus Enterococcus testudinis TaxID=1834191 RepID=A0A242A7K2_9ENTE|nr:tRNA (adenosine(37)-N6)-threonylcarbamoyltransferase complex dimerization subunit type 1 TsaB [Enterococcus sp. 8G7_MSG3316]OTN77027.1 tRNA threonylcarbamoyl adenosine modification protein YeaZ [Enterococcus sp. 8G7_MSG3316]